MKAYVEHVNLTVSDTDASIDFIQTAVPDFSIRKRWETDGYEWTHIGTETTYLALMRPLTGIKESQTHNTDRTGYNHVCIVVDSVEKVRQALLSKGFKNGFNDTEIISTAVRKSVYFHDPDGNEFEFMEYLTDDLVARNSYEI